VHPVCFGGGADGAADAVAGVEELVDYVAGDAGGGLVVLGSERVLRWSLFRRLTSHWRL